MINITPLPGGLGARIDGLDLSIDLSDQDAKLYSTPGSSTDSS